MGLRRTFLTSNWTCIFGNGCQGVLTGPAPELVQGCCSYGAHLVNKKDAAAGREGGRHADPGRVAEPRDQEERHPREQERRDGHPAGRRCLHLPEQARVRRRRRVRFPHRGHEAGRRPHDPQAGGVLAAAPAPRGCRRRRRGTRDLGHPAVGPPALGQGRTRVPLVVHRVTRRLRRDQAGLRGDASPSSRRWWARRPTTTSSNWSKSATGYGRRVWHSPIRPCAGPWCGDRGEPSLVVQRVVVGDGAGRHGTRGCGRTCPLRPGTTTRGRRRALPHTRHIARRLRRRSLQTARFLEAPMASLFHENSLSHPVRMSASRPLTAGPYGPCRPSDHCSGCGQRACPAAGQGGAQRRGTRLSGRSRRACRWCICPSVA